MTDMPQLQAFHSLVYLAAVLTWRRRFIRSAFRIGGEHAIRSQSLPEMSLGVAIGAITFRFA